MARPRLNPARWVPPSAPAAKGRYAPTRPPHPLTIFPVPADGPEDVLLGPDGEIYTGTADGTVWVLKEDKPAEVLGRTGGRPLGLEWHPDGSIVVCDAHRGLLRMAASTGAIETLVDGYGGQPFQFANNAAVARDGSIYFSDSSRRFGIENFKADLLEHSGTGRLLVRWPSGEVEVLVDGLDFSNGVALAPDESALLIAETGGYRIRRLLLSGPRAGLVEPVLQNLPGLPDNMSTGSHGLFWVALPSERNALLDRLLPLPGFLRQGVWALPDQFQPDASRILFVLGIDVDGQVRACVRAPGDRFHYVTGVREHDGQLYLGSLVESAVARIPVPESVR